MAMGEGRGWKRLAGSGDGGVGPPAKECGRLLEAGKGKEVDCALECQEGAQPCCHLGL